MLSQKCEEHQMEHGMAKKWHSIRALAQHGYLMTFMLLLYRRERAPYISILGLRFPFQIR